MIQRENEITIISDIQLDNARGLLGIRGTDKILNAWVRKFRGVKKVKNERIDETDGRSKYLIGYWR